MNCNYTYNQCCTNFCNPDQNFVQSIMPYLQGLSILQRLELRSNFLDLLIKAMKENLEQFKNCCFNPTCNCASDEETFYCTIIPHMKNLDPINRLKVREEFSIRLQKVLNEHLENLKTELKVAWESSKDDYETFEDFYEKKKKQSEEAEEDSKIEKHKEENQYVWPPLGGDASNKNDDSKVVESKEDKKKFGNLKEEPREKQVSEKMQEDTSGQKYEDVNYDADESNLEDEHGKSSQVVDKVRFSDNQNLNSRESKNEDLQREEEIDEMDKPREKQVAEKMQEDTNGDKVRFSDNPNLNARESKNEDLQREEEIDEMDEPREKQVSENMQKDTNGQKYQDVNYDADESNLEDENGKSSQDLDKVRLSDNQNLNSRESKNEDLQREIDEMEEEYRKREGDQEDDDENKEEILREEKEDVKRDEVDYRNEEQSEDVDEKQIDYEGSIDHERQSVDEELQRDEYKSQMDEDEETEEDEQNEEDKDDESQEVEEDQEEEKNEMLIESVKHSMLAKKICPNKRRIEIEIKKQIFIKKC